MLNLAAYLCIFHSPLIYKLMQKPYYLDFPKFQYYKKKSNLCIFFFNCLCELVVYLWEWAGGNCMFYLFLKLFKSVRCNENNAYRKVIYCCWDPPYSSNSMSGSNRRSWSPRWEIQQTFYVCIQMEAGTYDVILLHSRCSDPYATRYVRHYWSFLARAKNALLLVYWSMK